jgi:NAD(P)-dependent dehydrogenase (short-subunit alcohol dehydrogenase family)
MSFLLNLLYSQLLVTLPYPTVPLTGQTIIITGANTGLGYEAAKHCVRLCAEKVILAVRNVSNGVQARIAIEDAYPAGQGVIDVWYLDLLSIASIRAFAAKANGLDRLDVLLENAGMSTMTWKTFEGMESTIMTNVIGTELLALLLLPKLQETARHFRVQPKLSVVTSESHMVSVFAERREADIFAALNREHGANMDDR